MSLARDPMGGTPSALVPLRAVNQPLISSSSEFGDQTLSVRGVFSGTSHIGPSRRPSPRNGVAPSRVLGTGLPVAVANNARLPTLPVHLCKPIREGVSALRARDPPSSWMSPGEIETCHIRHFFCLGSRFQGTNVPN